MSQTLAFQQSREVRERQGAAEVRESRELQGQGKRTLYCDSDVMLTLHFGA